MGAPFHRQPFAALPEQPWRPHGYSESQGRDVVVDDPGFGRVRLHLRELGEGEPLLLIHGLMTSSYSWRYVMAPLARHYRVIVPDLPGAGRSEAVVGDYSAAALGGLMATLADALSIRGCRCIGNSMGGFIAMRAVLDHAELFSRLVNIHAPGLPELRLWALHGALRIPGMRAAVALAARLSPERWVHRNVHYYDETLKSREETRAYGDALASRDGSRAFVRYLSDTLAPASLSAFETDLRGGFPIPLQLIYARRDPMVPPAMGNRLKALLPKAELVWLEDSSHSAHVDTPQALLDAALPFLAR